MHHVRGLVRQAGRQTLRAIEEHVSSPLNAAACVRRVRLLDVHGRTTEVHLLHAGALLKLTTAMDNESALGVLNEVTQLLSAATTEKSAETKSVTPPAAGAATSSGSANNTTDRSDSAVSVLYVKDSCADVENELQRRQRRFISKLRGRFVSADQNAVEAALQTWLRQPAGTLSDTAVAEYRGMVEALAATDPSAAVALAINPDLPSLTSGASAALAGLVQLHAPTAVHAFLESFAKKDELTVAAETSATHLALRLRKELAQQGDKAGATGVKTSHSMPQNPEALASTTTPNTTAATSTTARLLCEAAHFNIDPGVVFPTEPAAIQNWAEHFLTSAMRPAQKASTLLELAQRRRLQPRRVAMDGLSVWALSDLERPWLASALQTQTTQNSEDRASSSTDAEAAEVQHHTAYQLALKDPKRNLIDNRLLHTYAAALARGDLSPLDKTFPAFFEECGECHGDHRSPERPTCVSFTLPPLPSEVPLRRALHDLAPQSSYWRTLLTHFGATHVQATTAPMGEVRVQVRLPEAHECVVAAEAGQVPLPALPVLYEDDDVLVVDKPAGLATSRHALSCTQMGAATTDLISVLLCTKFKGSEQMRSRVFRQGQVHRLDAETSGCLLIAKSDTAADSLRHQMGTSAAFSHQSKIYYALCVVLEPSLRSVKLHDEVLDAADPKIRTRYRVLQFFPKHRIAWVECRIQQGKKHQIRRHLASRGLPILADVEHGGAACCQSMMSRVALHARSVSFIHPVSADPLVVVAPLPADFRACLAQLK